MPDMKDPLFLESILIDSLLPFIEENKEFPSDLMFRVSSDIHATMVIFNLVDYPNAKSEGIVPRFRGIPVIWSPAIPDDSFEILKIAASRSYSDFSCECCINSRKDGSCPRDTCSFKRM